MVTRLYDRVPVVGVMDAAESAQMLGLVPWIENTDHQ